MAPVWVGEEGTSRILRDLDPEIPPFMGQGARGPRLGDWQWQQQQQHRGIRRAAAAMVGHGTWGIAIAKGEREGPGLVRCTRRLARWWDERTGKDKVRVSKRSDQRLCKQDDGIQGEITWIFRLNPMREGAREATDVPCRERAPSHASEPSRIGGDLGTGSASVCVEKSRLAALGCIMTRRVCCCFPPSSPLFPPLTRRAAYVGSLVVKDVLQAGGSRLRELGGGVTLPFLGAGA